MEIGKKIKQLREDKRITQTELANAIKSTKQTIFKYENGIITNIPMDKLITIASVLGCSPSYLLGWSETDKDNSATLTIPSNVGQSQVAFFGDQPLTQKQVDEVAEFIRFIKTRDENKK